MRLIRQFTGFSQLLVCVGFLLLSGTAFGQRTHPVEQLLHQSDVFEVSYSPNGQLYACGSFTMIDGKTVRRIAFWDGNQWNEVGQGLNAPAFGMVWIGDTLYVIGQFTSALNPDGTTVPVRYIAGWTGTRWYDVEGGLNRAALAITEYQGKVYVAGIFSTGGISNTPVGQVATFNPASKEWRSVLPGRRMFFSDGGPFNVFPSPADATPLNSIISTIRVFTDSAIFIGGLFDRMTDGIDTLLRRNVTYWNGSQWVNMGGGTNNRVHTVEFFQSRWVVGGAFTNAGGQMHPLIAEWNGTDWLTFQDQSIFRQHPSELVRRITRIDSSLGIAGLFGHINTNEGFISETREFVLLTPNRTWDSSALKSGSVPATSIAFTPDTISLGSTKSNSFGAIVKAYSVSDQSWTNYAETPIVRLSTPTIQFRTISGLPSKPILFSMFTSPKGNATRLQLVTPPGYSLIAPVLENNFFRLPADSGTTSFLIGADQSTTRTPSSFLLVREVDISGRTLARVTLLDSTEAFRPALRISNTTPQFPYYPGTVSGAFTAFISSNVTLNDSLIIEAEGGEVTISPEPFSRRLSLNPAVRSWLSPLNNQSFSFRFTSTDGITPAKMRVTIRSGNLVSDTEEFIGTPLSATPPVVLSPLDNMQFTTRVLNSTRPFSFPLIIENCTQPVRINSGNVIEFINGSTLFSTLTITPSPTSGRIDTVIEFRSRTVLQTGTYNASFELELPNIAPREIPFRITVTPSLQASYSMETAYHFWLPRTGVTIRVPFNFVNVGDSISFIGNSAVQFKRIGLQEFSDRVVIFPRTGSNTLMDTVDIRFINTTSEPISQSFQILDEDRTLITIPTLLVPLRAAQNINSQPIVSRQGETIRFTSPLLRFYGYAPFRILFDGVPSPSSVVSFGTTTPSIITTVPVSTALTRSRLDVRFENADTSFVFGSVFHLIEQQVDRPAATLPLSGAFETTTDYRMVGMPLRGLDLSDFTRLGDIDFDWRFFRFDVTRNQFEQLLPGNQRLKLGEGIWAISRRPVQSSRESVSAPLALQSTSISVVPNQWNIISNPLLQPISWEKIKQTNQLPEASRLFTYQGEYEPATLLTPYQGYLFFAPSNVDRLVFLSDELMAQVPLQTPSEGDESLPRFTDDTRSPAQHAFQDPNADWQIHVRFTASRYRDDYNFFGLRGHDSAFAMSQWVRKPPRFLNQAMLSFEEIHDRETLTLCEAYHPHTVNGLNSWVLSLSNSELGRSRLHFDGVAKLPKGVSLALLHPERGQFWDLKKQATVEFHSEKEIERFKVIYGPSSLVTDEVNRLVPTRFQLDQNFPNPFNPQTTIRYVVAQRSLVSLNVYDILGRRVVQLENGIKEPGSYTSVFNAPGLSSGVYLYRLTSGEVSLTKKMLLIK